MKYYSKIIRLLNLPKQLTRPSSLIPEVCTKLNLDYSAVIDSLKILELYEKYHNLSGYNTLGIIAGVIYLACLKNRIPRSQNEIAIQTGVSTITLRARFKELQKISHLIH